MKCDIYRSQKKEDTYLYLRHPADLDIVPETLSKTLGKLDHVMELELSAEKKLAREDAKTVMENITEQGFHLQMPPKLESLLAKHNPNN